MHACVRACVCVREREHVCACVCACVLMCAHVCMYAYADISICLVVKLTVDLASLNYMKYVFGWPKSLMYDNSAWCYLKLSTESLILV